MQSMISYAEERGEKRGEKKGIKKGENRLGMLMKILLDDKRYADAKRASEDEKYREQLYKEFEIQPMLPLCRNENRKLSAM